MIISMKCLIEDVEQSGRMMVVGVQQRVERREWRVGLNNDIRYLLVWISPLSPEIIITSLGGCEIDSNASMISAS